MPPFFCAVTNWPMSPPCTNLVSRTLRYKPADCHFQDRQSPIFNTSMTSISGNIFMIVAPSGAGKSSLVNAVLRDDTEIVLSISCTTRTPRPGEEDDKHYRFVSLDQFKMMRENNELLEWAEVH